MKLFKYKSLTKNWPGGRRRAVIIEEQLPTWNKQIQDFTAHTTNKDNEDK